MLVETFIVIVLLSTALPPGTRLLIVRLGLERVMLSLGRKVKPISTLLE